MDEQNLGSEQSGDDVPLTDRSFSRGKLLKTAGIAGAGIAFGGIAGNAKAWTPSSRNAALSKNRLERGMVGGPTGFPGAQRYQYAANTAPGRSAFGPVP